MLEFLVVDLEYNYTIYIDLKGWYRVPKMWKIFDIARNYCKPIQTNLRSHIKLLGMFRIIYGRKNRKLPFSFAYLLYPND